MIPRSLVAIVGLMFLVCHLKYPEWTFGFCCVLVATHTFYNIWRKLVRKLKRWFRERKNPTTDDEVDDIVGPERTRVVGGHPKLMGI